LSDLQISRARDDSDGPTVVQSSIELELSRERAPGKFRGALCPLHVGSGFHHFCQLGCRGPGGTLALAFNHHPDDGLGT
jgi:hypothetical protein